MFGFFKKKKQDEYVPVERVVRFLDEDLMETIMERAVEHMSEEDRSKFALSDARIKVNRHGFVVTFISITHTEIKEG